MSAVPSINAARPVGAGSPAARVSPEVQALRAVDGGLPADNDLPADGEFPANGNLPPDAERMLACMKDRYACKLFTLGREIPEDHLMAVLEAGRLAPSSFGLEPWQFFVSRSRSIKDALFGACFSQENIRTASCIVAIAVRTAPHYHPDSDFIRRRAQRFPGGYPVFRADYAGYWEFLNAAGSLEPWARAQGYIAATQMMLAAASLGVDSCAIEGYVEDDIRAILGLDASQWRLSMLLPLGYRAEDRREKIRENLDDLVVFKD